jgi:hypothetical protein
MTVIQGPWGDVPVGGEPGGPEDQGDRGEQDGSRRGQRFFPPSKPRKAVGGIKARSKRGAIGEQWWSRRFIDVLESFGMQTRLARGRNYARTGQVLNLDIATGYVTAQVQGSRVKPYKVVLTVDPLTKPQWRTVEQALAARAVFRARLLAGEMPAEIEEIFADCGTPLFPRSARDLAMSCTCPDWEVPCKHVAAVCYVLAEAFDDDPFEMLAWRGKGREDLLAALRGSAGSSGSGAGSGGAGSAGSGGRGAGGSGAGGGRAGGGRAGGGRATAPGEGTDRPLADSLSGFWSSSLSPARLRALPPASAAPADLLLRGFEPPPIQIRDQDLATILRPAYDVMAADGPDAPDAPR